LGVSLDANSCITTHNIHACLAPALGSTGGIEGPLADGLEWAKLAQYGFFGAGILPVLNGIGELGYDDGWFSESC
jgi:hypothetical protein